MITGELFATALILDLFVFLFGFLWFNVFFKEPFLVGLKNFMNEKVQKRKRNDKLIFSMGFFLTLLALLVLGIAIQKFSMDGFYAGILFWSLYALVDFVNGQFTRMPGKVQLINNLYWLVVLATSGVVFGIVL